jgi:hypothetical protein
MQQVVDFLYGGSAFEPTPAAQADRYQGIEQVLRHVHNSPHLFTN